MVTHTNFLKAEKIAPIKWCVSPFYWLCLLLSLLCSECFAQSPPTYKEMPATSAPGWKTADPRDAMLHGKWWEIFKDPELNALEDELNINNQNIKQAFENFMAARAIIGEARAPYFPTLTTSPSYTVNHNPSGFAASGTSSSSVTSSGGKTTSLLSVPLDVAWAPDLFGKVRKAVEVAQYNAQLSAADLENERLLEQATLAITFFQIRGQDASIKLYNDTVAADKKSLELARARYETGVDTQVSVVEAQNTLQNAQAAATNLGVARAQYEHAIATLIGKAATDFSIPVKPMLVEPPAIPVGVPSELLERRPDIAAAERAMAAANAQIGVARAAFYPTLTLSGAGGFESSAISNLFTLPNFFWSLGASLFHTIFEGGLRHATVNQFVAVYNANLAGYRQTVLNAFQQVEDQLAQTRILSQQIIQQKDAEQSAKQFVDLEIDRYRSGIDPYVNVVIAQTTLLSDQQTLTTLHVQEMVASVQLIEALGGGWDKSQLPTVQEVSKPLTKEETAIQH